MVTAFSFGYNSFIKFDKETENEAPEKTIAKRKPKPPHSNADRTDSTWLSDQSSDHVNDDGAVENYFTYPKNHRIIKLKKKEEKSCHY